MQVPEATARHLQDQNVSCTFRDTINVKGKGEMRVYNIDLDKEGFVMEVAPVQQVDEEKEER